MPPSVRFAADAADAIVAHAREGAAGSPVEVCGVLAGRQGDDDRVTSTYRIENVAGSPRVEYELDPAETVETIDELETRGDDLVGFYHSHPEGPTGPSATDQSRATWPGYVYCIVSLAGSDPTIGAWRWTGESFVALDVVVE